VDEKMPEKMHAHFRLDFAGGAATLCALRDDHGYRVGLALCSPRDQFSRKRGREISYGRAVAGSVAFSFKPSTRDDLGGQLRRAFAEYMATARDLPRWAKRRPFLMDVRWSVHEDTALIMMA